SVSSSSNGGSKTIRIVPHSVQRVSVERDSVTVIIFLPIPSSEPIPPIARPRRRAGQEGRAIPNRYPPQAMQYRTWGYHNEPQHTTHTPSPSSRNCVPRAIGWWEGFRLSQCLLPPLWSATCASTVAAPRGLPRPGRGRRSYEGEPGLWPTCLAANRRKIPRCDSHVAR